MVQESGACFFALVVVAPVQRPLMARGLTHGLVDLKLKDEAEEVPESHELSIE